MLPVFRHPLRPSMKYFDTAMAGDSPNYLWGACRPVPSPSSITMDSEEERRKQKKRERGNAAVRRTREKQAREAREKAEKMERLPRENKALEANIEGFKQVRWSWNHSSQEFHQP